MANDDPYLAPLDPATKVKTIAQQSGVPADVADDYLKVTQVESGHNIAVRNSAKGARGFGQVMPDVKGGKIRTVGGQQYDLTNPTQNITAGLKYFHEGGSDPIARRLYYFGGPGARAHYQRTGKIPNISDGNMSAQQYVQATSGFQKPAEDPYLARLPQQQSPQAEPDADPYLAPLPQQAPTGNVAAKADLPDDVVRSTSVANKPALKPIAFDVGNIEEAGQAAGVNVLGQSAVNAANTIAMQGMQLPKNHPDLAGKRVTLKFKAPPTPEQINDEALRQLGGEPYVELGNKFKVETGQLLANLGADAKPEKVGDEYVVNARPTQGTIAAINEYARDGGLAMKNELERQNTIRGSVARGVQTELQRPETSLLNVPGIPVPIPIDTKGLSNDLNRNAVAATLSSAQMVQNAGDLAGMVQGGPSPGSDPTAQAIGSAQSALPQPRTVLGEVANVPLSTANTILQTEALGPLGKLAFPAQQALEAAHLGPEEAAKRALLAAPLVATGPIAEAAGINELSPLARQAATRGLAGVGMAGSAAAGGGGLRDIVQGGAMGVGFPIGGRGEGREPINEKPLGIEAAPEAGVRGNAGMAADRIIAEREAKVTDPRQRLLQPPVPTEPVHHSQFQDRQPDGTFKKDGLDIEALAKAKAATERRVADVPLPEGTTERRGTTVATPTELALGQEMVRQHTNRRAAERDAEVDQLTGVANQKALIKAMPGMESDPNTTILSLDVRNLKAANTILGRDAGSQVIKDAADALRQAAAENGVTRVFRDSGDEILAGVPNDKADAIRQRASEIFQARKAGQYDVGIDIGAGSTRAEADADLKTRKSGESFRPIESADTSPAKSPPSSPEVNVPERPETITAQLDQRGYALIPEGNPLPTLSRGMRALKIRDGVVYYDPKRIDAATIRSTPTTELLGHVEPKSDATTRAVVTRNPDGSEYQASAVSPENEAAQVELAKANAPEGATVESGGADLATKVLKDRVAPDLPPARPDEPAFIKAARQRLIEHNEFLAKGGEYRGSGGPNTQPLIDALLVHGYDFYTQKVKPTFEAWSKKLRDQFGPESDEHLAGVWRQLGGEEPRESSTAANRAKVTEDRAARGEEPIPPPERKADTKLLADATAANAADPTEPMRLADQVLNGKKDILNDTETVQLDLHQQKLKNQYDAVNKELVETTDPATIERLSNQSDAMEREMRTTEEAWAKSGTEKGRALRSQRTTIDQDYRLLTMVAKRTKALGRELTAAERSTIKTQAAEIERLNKSLTAATEQADAERLARATKRIKSDADAEVRRAARSGRRADLDTEAAQLKQLIVQAWKKVGSSNIHGMAAVDPEGELTKLVLKLVRNRVKAKVGITAEALVDEVHGLLKDAIDVDKRKIRDIISGYGRPKGTRTGLQKQIDALKSELYGQSSAEDVAAGRRSAKREGPTLRQGIGAKQGPQLGPRQGPKPTEPAWRKRVQGKIDELQRRIDSGDFSKGEAKRPVIHTKETFALQQQLDRIKRDYDNANYRATRSTAGKVMDTAVAVGNVPKTLLSMGDVSALGRQGGVDFVVHPVLSSKATVDMLRSFTARGFTNVENEIKAHPLFEEARRNGVEFTGVDQTDPHLSHKEEGYFGSGIIDTAAKGKLNPIRLVKGVKDFSERTFVSFLDSQRMRVYAHQAEFLKGMKGLTPAELKASLKAVAEQVNDATGRGSLGHYGNAHSPTFNLALFSPRLLASRVRLLNKMFNPVAWYNMPKGARKLIMIDNAKFMAFSALTLGLAAQAGAKVNADPDDADFLKFGVGNSKYDTLAGLQQPLRFVIRMAKAMKGGETYSGDSKGKILADFTRGKASPEVGYAWDYLAGSNRMTGKKFDAVKDTERNLLPLPMQDFYEAIKTDGKLRGTVEAIPSLLGIGVQTYKTQSERPTTHAEKLARRFVRNKMPDSARTQQQIDLDTTKTDLRARARKGEDVSGELAKLGSSITPEQVKAITNARNKTRLQEDMNKLGAEDAIIVWGVMNVGQQQATRELLQRKAGLIDHLPSDKRDAVRKRYEAAGIKAVEKPKGGAFGRAFGRAYGGAQP